MKSLHIIALPNSMTSIVGYKSMQATGLNIPEWSINGEILNFDNYTMIEQNGHNHWATAENHSKEFEGYLNYLKDIIKTRDTLYKTVSQPFVVSHFYASESVSLNSFKIDRPIADIAFCMLKRDWTYPKRAYSSDSFSSDSWQPVVNEETKFLVGLIRARIALDEISIPSIQYEDLIYESENLYEILTDFYSERAVKTIDYIDDQFKEKREKVLKRRESDRYKTLERKINNLRKNLSMPE